MVKKDVCQCCLTNRCIWCGTILSSKQVAKGHMQVGTKDAQTLQSHDKHILWKPPFCECRHQRCHHVKGVDFYSDDELSICSDHAELPEWLITRNVPFSPS